MYVNSTHQILELQITTHLKFTVTTCGVAVIVTVSKSARRRIGWSEIGVVGCVAVHVGESESCICPLERQSELRAHCGAPAFGRCLAGDHMIRGYPVKSGDVLLLTFVLCLLSSFDINLFKSGVV